MYSRIKQTVETPVILIDCPHCHKQFILTGVIDGDYYAQCVCNHCPYCGKEIPNEPKDAVDIIQNIKKLSEVPDPPPPPPEELISESGARKVVDGT